MSETPNHITPRQLAVALVAHEIADLEARITSHADSRGLGGLFDSQLHVFLQQTRHELRRAMVFLERSAPDEHTPA